MPGRQQPIVRAPAPPAQRAERSALLRALKGVVSSDHFKDGSVTRLLMWCLRVCPALCKFCTIGVGHDVSNPPTWRFGPEVERRLDPQFTATLNGLKVNG